MDKLGGQAVVRAYVDDCLSLGKRLDPKSYAFSPVGHSASDLSSDDAQRPHALLATVTCTPEPPSPPLPKRRTALSPSPTKRHKTDASPGPAPAPAQVSEGTGQPRPFDLCNVFTGMTFYIQPPGAAPGANPFMTPEQIARYLVAHDGRVLPEDDAGSVDLVVVPGAGTPVRGLRRDRSVNAGWVWACVNARKLVGIEEFRVGSG